MRTSGIVVHAQRFAVAAAIWLAAGAATPPPAGGLAELNRLVGTWQSSGTFVDSAYGKAGSANATTTCAWSGDGLFLICQQRVVMNGKPDDGVAIYSYDASTQKYHFYNVGVARANGTEIAVSRNTITYSDSFVDAGKHASTRTLNVWDSPQRYHWRTEYSLDGGAHWNLIGSGTSTRIK
ncbi:MAG: DUF1579 family protein [Candidatus Tumulicola sp.]